MPAPIITPSSAVLSGEQTQQFTADQAVTWTASAGSITAGGLYTASQTTGTHTVTATNAALQASNATVSVTARLAYDADVSSTGVTKRHVDVSEGIYLKRWTVGRSPALRFYNLEFPNRPDTEWAAVKALHETHWPDKLIYWTDAFLNQERKFYIDSKFNWTRVSRKTYDYKLALREYKVYAPSSVGAVSSIFPYMIDYGFEVEQSGEVWGSDAWDWSRQTVAVAKKDRVEVTCYDRSAAEFLAAELFWIYHYPGRAFTLQHGALLGLTKTYQMDSDFSWQYSQHNMVDYKFIVREV